ncbi:MAG: cytochrome C oxidase subunit I, partial [Halobacteria archaeon]|nr:cytochrome C oxidase subunit I [Halobacteria archaeon]
VLFGVPRRHPSVMNIPGTDFSFEAAQPLFAIFGIAAILAVTGGALFLLVAVASLLFGEKITPTTPVSDTIADGGEQNKGKAAHLYSMRGTFFITLIFLAVFVVMYVLNWYLLSELWMIGG